MSAIRGKYVNGRVILYAPVDWPNGMKVTVRPAVNGESLGMRDEDWPTMPEGIAGLLAQMDRFETTNITPEDEADIPDIRDHINPR
jgi:hypothetical protein